MVSVLAGIRYALFALYIICSGVLVTAAAWHLGLASTVGTSAQLDAFVIFLGAFGLLFILSIAFIDTLRKHAVTSAVWFELAWIGLFWVFYLAAASAATAVGPSMFCSVESVDVLGWKDACAAIKVIIAFTWIGSAAFLVHLFTLLVLSLLHAPQSPGVWHSGVRDFPWLDFAARPSFRNSVSANGGVRMGSEPSSPNKYHYERRMAAAQAGLAPVSVPAQPAAVAPIHARMATHQESPYAAHPFASTAISRPPPVHNLESAPYQYKPERETHARTQSQAIVEQFRTGQGSGNRSSGQMLSNAVRALPKVPQVETQGVKPLQLVRKLPEPQQQSLYPLHVQSTMNPSASSTISYSQEPQPLGEWPRRNPPADTRRQRSAAPPAFRATERIPASIPSAGAMTTTGARERVNRRESAESTGSSVDSNGFARRKDGRPKHRPPPLDFTKLNAGRQ